MDKGMGTDTPETIEKRTKTRYIQALLYFLGLIAGCGHRTNLSVAIVVMTDNSTNSNFDTFDWDESTRGLLLSALFWGYAAIQFPAGLLCHRFGAKIIFLAANFLSSVLTILTPLIAPLGWMYVCCIRILIGMCQGCILPTIYTLSPKWIHPSERAISSMVVSGNPLGSFIMIIPSGYIATSNLGWPGIFYISGVIGIAWSILWFWLGSESPSAHKHISENERKYLEESYTTGLKARLPIPWTRILSSMAFLSIVITHSAQGWGFYTLTAEMPSYLKGVFDFDIKSNAILTALPYLAMGLMTIFISPLSDFLINKKYLSRILTRKIFNTFGEWIPAICIIGLGFVNQTSHILAAVLLIMALGFNAGTNMGFMVNHMDLAPNFSGTLFGITNCAANIFAILGPIFVGFVVTDLTNPYEWNIFFYVTSAIYFVGNLIFLIFGKATIQDWNEEKSTII